MSFGIAAMAHVLGDPVPVAAAAPQYTTDLEKIRSWGYQTLHRAAAGTGLTDLAAAAGHRALERAGMLAADLDLVVLAMSDIAEYLYWDAAAATQARLGARHAEALLLNQACGSGVASFDAVAGKLATHPGYRTALIIAANRVCEPYWNRMETITSVSSDGAVAAVAVRGHPSCRWLTTTVLTDGRYADFMRLEDGGTARPFTAGGQRVAAVASPFDRLDGFFDGDVREMLRFANGERAQPGGGGTSLPAGRDPARRGQAGHLPQRQHQGPDFSGGRARHLPRGHQRRPGHGLRPPGLRRPVVLPGTVPGRR